MGLASTGLILLLIRQPRQYPIELLPPPTLGPLSIHVAGAAERPGVYFLPYGSIVQDALDAAGGPTSSADLDRINLAADLEDGQRVYVPQITTSGTSTGEEFHPSEIDPGQMININTAGAAELELLPGIGPSLAKESSEQFPLFQLLSSHFQYPGSLWEAAGLDPPKYVERMSEDPIRARQFSRMLYELHHPLAEEIANQLDMSRVNQLMDLGGGTGVVSMALLRRHSHLSALVVDFPDVCTAGRELAVENSLDDRLIFHPADFIHD